MKNARRVMEEAYRDYAKIIGRDYGNPFVSPTWLMMPMS
jgi:hypothetical protein